jgi:hypothetical protein
MELQVKIRIAEVVDRAAESDARPLRYDTKGIKLRPAGTERSIEADFAQLERAPLQVCCAGLLRVKVDLVIRPECFALHAETPPRQLNANILLAVIVEQTRPARHKVLDQEACAGCSCFRFSGFPEARQIADAVAVDDDLDVAAFHPHVFQGETLPEPREQPDIDFHRVCLEKAG